MNLDFYLILLCPKEDCPLKLPDFVSQFLSIKVATAVCNVLFVSRCMSDFLAKLAGVIITIYCCIFKTFVEHEKD